MKGAETTDFPEDGNFRFDTMIERSIYETTVNGLLTNESSAALWEFFEKRPFCLHWKHLPQPRG